MPGLSDLAHLPESALFKEFSITTKGLNTSQVHQRLKTYGPNTFTTSKKTSALLEYLKNFKDPLIIVLILIAIHFVWYGRAHQRHHY
jgi:magnesium-transporting ATPase (P-type)